MKSITGYFQSVYKAQKTYSQLKKLGVHKVNMDIVDRFSKNDNKISNGVFSSEDGSLSNLILRPGGGEISMELRPLYAADPTVSGMGRFSEVTDANIIITAMVDDSEEKNVIEIITQNEGQM